VPQIRLAGCWRLEADMATEAANGSMGIVKHHVPGPGEWEQAQRGAESGPLGLNAILATRPMHPCVVAFWERLLGRGAFVIAPTRFTAGRASKQYVSINRASDWLSAPAIGWPRRPLAGRDSHWLAASGWPGLCLLCLRSRWPSSAKLGRAMRVTSAEQGARRCCVHRDRTSRREQRSTAWCAGCLWP
jgi:hypothetical protein